MREVRWSKESDVDLGDVIIEEPMVTDGKLAFTSRSIIEGRVMVTDQLIDFSIFSDFFLDLDEHVRDRE